VVSVLLDNLSTLEELTLKETVLYEIESSLVADQLGAVLDSGPFAFLRADTDFLETR